MTKRFLVINVGSSSIRFQVLDMPDCKVLLKGRISDIGQSKGLFEYSGEANSKKKETVDDITQALGMVLGLMVKLDIHDLDCIVHRVMHGGPNHTYPVIMSNRLLKSLEPIQEMEPIQNPKALLVIKECMEVFFHSPNVAVFDTEFHSTIDQKNYTIPLPKMFLENGAIRKYGFHGISHEYLVKKTSLMLKKNKKSARKIITVHAGNDISVCATQDGISINTSMGFTPLTGPIMGTRTGDIDVGVLEYISRKEGLAFPDIYNLINTHGGLYGLTHHSDIRKVKKDAAKGNQSCAVALEMCTLQIARLIAGYVCDLDGVDAIVFSGGIGEEASWFRQLICNNLRWIGLKLSKRENEKNCEGIISTTASSCTAMMLHTDEERMMAEKAYELLENSI